MKRKILLFLLCVCIGLVSCSHESDGRLAGADAGAGGGNLPHDHESDDRPAGFDALKYLDIADAKTLYISSADAASRSARNASTSQKMFKITEDGYVEEVKYLDENKNEISVEQQPAVIQPVNDDYIFVGFGWSGYVESSYLVRKSDGAIFDMTTVGNPVGNDVNGGNYGNAPMFITDKNNNLYYLTYNYTDSSSKIIKVNLNDTTSLSAATVSASTDEVTCFDVDWNGNVIYFGGMNERIRKTNGSFENFASDVGFASTWLGLDGNFYCKSYTDSKEEYNGIDGFDQYFAVKRITIDDSFKVNYEFCGYDTDAYLTFDRGYYGRFVVKDKLLFIGSDILEVDGDGTSINMKKITLDGLNMQSLWDVTSTENFYYIFGTDTTAQKFLIRVDPTDHSYINILPGDDYDVFSFTASETDGITFNALRMSDGKKVSGQVGLDGGAVRILDEEGDAEITYLQRIN